MAEGQRLLRLHRRLSEVLADKDWEALGPIDQAIQGCLRALAAEPQLPEAVRVARRNLQHLHQQAREQAAAECERLRRLLLSHLDYSEGLAAYQRVDDLQGSW